MKGEKMTKRVLCLLSVLLIGALIMSSCGCVKESKKEKISKKQETFPKESKVTISDWETYENPKWGYKLNYPSDWAVVINTEMFDDSWFEVSWFDITSPEKLKTPQRVELTYEVGAFFLNQSIEKRLNDYLEVIKSRTYNFRCEEYTNTTIDNLPAIKVVFTYRIPCGETITSNEKGYEKHLLYTVIGKEGKIYQLHYMSFSFGVDDPYEVYEKYLDVANQMTKSFRFI
jgi:hypothetical protein